MSNVPLLDEVNTRGQAWEWFAAHAKSRLALVWLAVIAFTDTVFSPFSSEPFLAALVLANRERWRTYLAVALTFACLGTATGYWLLYWLFRAFGEGLLVQWGFADAYTTAQTLLGTHIVLAMLTASFTPLPDKAFIYAAGVLGAPFVPFLAAFAVGRGARMALVTFVVWKFGPAVLELYDRYAVWATLGLVAIVALYGMVRFDLLPW